MIYGEEFSLRNKNCYTHIRYFYPDLPEIKYKVLSAEEFLAIALDNGFTLVDNIKDTESGDVFITNEPVHLMYYKGQQLVSHHPINKLSLTEYIDGEMLSNIKYIVRSKHGKN